MKILPSFPTAPKSKATLTGCILIALLGLFVFVIQIWRIHALWTPVGYVDTWPLYDRLMHWHQGHLSLDHYLFDPHGPHLHFIIYLLYLIDVTCGSGRQFVPHLATLFSIVGLIATLSYVFFRSYPPNSTWTLAGCVWFFGTLVLLSGVSDATAIPFQAIVVVTRFVYILLLSVLAWCLFFPHRWLHVSALIASCIAASFYAASGIFAMEVLALHIIFYRRWRPLLLSWLPLASYLWLMGHYVKPNAEFVMIGRLLREHSRASLFEIAIGTVCYYGTILVHGWPVRAHEATELIIALVVCTVTTIWAAYTLISIFLKIRRGAHLTDARMCMSCILALLAIFVFASAVSAALLMLARARLFLNMPAHLAVLNTSRYEAFASVAYVIFLYIVLRSLRPRLASVVALATFCLMAVCGFSTAMRFNPYLNGRDSLETAATALLMGMSPAGDEAGNVWPGVSSDWYWPGELPKTAAYLQAGGFSYAYRLPALGQFPGWPTVKIYDYSTQPVAQGETVERVVDETQTLAVNLTDPNWRKGIWIASKGAMFIVPETDDVGQRIAVGDELSFARSGARRVVHVTKGSPIAIEVSGASLDPEGDGYPKPITVQIRRDVTTVGGTVCRVNGSMASFETANWIAPQRFFPITITRGEVIGFADRNGTGVHGHLNCADVANHPALFLSERQ